MFESEDRPMVPWPCADWKRKPPIAWDLIDINRPLKYVLKDTFSDYEWTFEVDAVAAKFYDNLRKKCLMDCKRICCSLEKVINETGRSRSNGRKQEAPGTARDVWL